MQTDRQTDRQDRLGEGERGREKRKREAERGEGYIPRGQQSLGYRKREELKYKILIMT